MDKLLSTKNILDTSEDESKDLSDADFIVTTGRGRKKKAHIPDEDGTDSLCGHMGRKLKAVDEETVDRFYTVCSICERLS